MAFYPTSPFPIQFVNPATGLLLSGGAIEAFLASDSSPTEMYTDKNGTSAGDTITLNAGGYPEVSGSTVVIHLDSNVEYKFILKNALGTQIWNVTNIVSLASQDSGTLNFNTLSGALSDTFLTVGDVLIIKDRYNAVYDVVAAGTGTEDSFIYHNDTIDGSTFQLQLRFDEKINFLHAGAVGDYNFSTRTGTDNAAAWESYLTYVLSNGLVAKIPEGNFYGVSAFGTVANAAVHNIEEVDYSNIHIEGAGSDRTFLICKKAVTTDAASVTVTRPALKSDGATEFRLSGVTLDGNIQDESELGGSLTTGSFTETASMIEVKDASRVRIEDVRVRHFAQHWDSRTPEDGNYGRRGPLFLNNCDDIDYDVKIETPTHREGIFMHDCTNVRAKIVYQGEEDASDNVVSTPANIFGPNTQHIDVSVYARGAWRGSVLNIGGIGDFKIDIDMVGNIATENDTDGDARTRYGTNVWGKGLDFGSEHQEDYFTGHPKLTNVVLRNVKIRNAFSYSIRGVKDSGTRGGFLDCQNVYVHNSFEGLRLDEWEDVHLGNVTLNNIIQYADYSSSNGYALRLTGIDHVSGSYSARGDATAVYTYPNATTSSTDTTPKTSRYNALITKTNGCLKMYSHDFKFNHIVFDVDSADDSTYSFALDIEATTDNYTSKAGSADFITLGTNASTERLLNCRLRGHLDYQTLVGNSEVTVNAVTESFEAANGRSSTTTALEDNTAAINTGAAKVEGYQVYNETTGLTVIAAGNGDSDVWVYMGTGTTAHTPV